MGAFSTTTLIFLLHLICMFFVWEACCWKRAARVRVDLGGDLSCDLSL